MVRIVYLNYGFLDMMFIEDEEREAIEQFWGIFGSPDTPRNTGGIRVLDVSQALNEKDLGGYQMGIVAKEVA
ncbi:hypothetical protein [Paenibacillus polymyxa]|uniref:Uncharacterized protein n=1 Tax=Paenibacillus polymyxa (strain SC2) TaxID=886882 RepID=E3EJQ9_PAEPS|nr:hypothetical protein [Paenibacillus polymyxa]ADO59657.1 hypothetical protein PPSC2_26840 [Paenibacillus polymyxa SC2]WPQ59517.1 hypothetical protein SKN87_28045 [Paenibacillus polymyxa]